ncbi:MAG: hypothetical protein WB523_19800 [Candidatus Sulfotelmatobacter sp.]
MSATVTMKQIVEASPRFRARITAAFYLLTILMGGLVLFVHGRWTLPVDLIATSCYIALTALFYDLSKPGNRSLPLLAALATRVDSASRALRHRARHETLRQFRVERRTP